MNQSACGVSVGCGSGVCMNNGLSCYCPYTRFGRDCSVTLSQFIGQTGFITFEFFSIALYFILAIVAGLMTLSIFYNRNALKIVLLHRIGIVMIFFAAVCRTIFYVAMAIDESTSTKLLILHSILFPIMISIFLFQVIIWFEAMRGIITNTMVSSSDKAARSRRVYVLSFIFSVIMFVLEFILDILTYIRAFDYSPFDFGITLLQGLSCLVIAISFWICQCVIAANLRKIRRNLDRHGDNKPAKYSAVAPICMSVCACITVFGGNFQLERESSS
eukprot:TRINITY_DN3063_c0_g1_i1.p2 TRINITY_DN3063_c0_g1~~TRINITY_DN3063_c0_g1_i1.p2  ORF type:complete len:274 (+),score=26.34 TRINITY_DN3063_c0_g1_i1:1374-2195(+)